MDNTIKLKVLYRIVSGGYRNMAHCFVDTGKTTEEKNAMTKEAWDKHVASVKRRWAAKSVSVEWRETSPYDTPIVKD